jgi:hypothetical protein
MKLQFIGPIRTTAIRNRRWPKCFGNAAGTQKTFLIAALEDVHLERGDV